MPDSQLAAAHRTHMLMQAVFTDAQDTKPDRPPAAATAALPIHPFEGAVALCCGDAVSSKQRLARAGGMEVPSIPPGACHMCAVCHMCDACNMCDACHMGDACHRGSRSM